ncbi:peptidoglycan editing factor PgeF [Sulfurospirillum barnesii]|uniref:Purine nucleoside phosphorylase n=1 Tax=Sulfurospirillum barnesii (strain ATCC 700032 / DSM 10660 / SES-3) TaxID=760154 RepID=I3XZ24_SULBS|nr:peptidoglycan editing factor PgeF [Sulfurospirillum barnesii]AFL69198.1 uncharacterized protein, YfiH family [Sulfurospirillum barnesii SES-3]
MRYLFTERCGGVSEGAFSTLNLALHVNDNALHVKENRDILREKIGARAVVFMEQVHKDAVVVVEHEAMNPTCDAMITNQKGIALAVMVADCLPLLMYDPIHEAIGVAHAGREGSKQGIGVKCVEAMMHHFGTEVKEVRVMMGPCIGACCYEVGKEVTQGFESVLHVKNERLFLDLLTYNLNTFAAMGILDENIERSTVCTCCDERYFSYRREKTTGRFAGVICL